MEKLNDKKTTILATCFDDVNIYPYQVKTKGKHPIRWFDGGSYYTEDDTINVEPSGDLGWWWLNKRDYETFKQHLKPIVVDEYGNVIC